MKIMKGLFTLKHIMTSYYFDYNATTPIAPEVREAMEPFFNEHFGNPSSLHHLGKISAKAVREARRKIAACLVIDNENELIFTSGGTESNNAAIRSALVSSGKKEIVISAVEHSSIRSLAKILEKEGYIVRRVGVDHNGRLNMDELRSCLSDQTAVVSLMMANNETGVLFDIEAAGAIIKSKGIPFHVDAVQGVGKVSINLRNSLIDFLSLSGHKFNAPKGTGALYVRSSMPFKPFVLGGGQERARRAGTENVAYLVGMARACEWAYANLAAESQRLKTLRDRFETLISQKISDIQINGLRAPRLPNTTSILFKHVDGEGLLLALDQKGICASTGSACMSGSPEPSYVLKAMGLSDDEAHASIRFSFGRFTKESDIDTGVAIVADTVNYLRNLRSRAGNSQTVILRESKG
ncbi:MAG: aminotransferase class V-fold PLP-dependent enzyme [Candidatus Omnitrophica bacterium]|nr:aminotransferase class V-fold PLP-dependent enzyme [Candidatus Omnitrophota bacterium]